MRLEHIPWGRREAPVESDLRRQLAADGFDVIVWSDPPHRTYAPHDHAHDENLWCVRGAITFQIAGTDYRLGPGDRLMLPRQTVHAAAVGSEGATYLIGEKA